MNFSNKFCIQTLYTAFHLIKLQCVGLFVSVCDSSRWFSVAEAWVEKPSYGKSLEEHLNISGREIAFPIEACVTMLLECGMQEEVEGNTHTQHFSMSGVGCCILSCMSWFHHTPDSSQ